MEDQKIECILEIPMEELSNHESLINQLNEMSRVNIANLSDKTENPFIFSWIFHDITSALQATLRIHQACKAEPPLSHRLYIDGYLYMAYGIFAQMN